MNIEFVRKTSFWTSRAMLSTVPGFERPIASLRLEKDDDISRSNVIAELFMMIPDLLEDSSTSAIV